VAGRLNHSAASCVPSKLVAVVQDNVRLYRLRLDREQGLEDSSKPGYRLKNGYTAKIDILGIQFMNGQRSLSPLLKLRGAAEVIRMTMSNDDEADIAERDMVS
jgi:hypothetical protein